MDKIYILQNMINESNNIVVFTGAGVSTESGIKDFRSNDGIYNTIEEKYKKQPEYMLSNDCLYDHPKEFYEFYKKYLNCLDIKPNITHKYLKKLEDSDKLKAIITQNIDGLHTKAGSKNVCEIHGTVYKNYCMDCKKKYNAEYVFNGDGISKCSCGGIIRPNVVLYGEMLPEEEYNESLLAISKSDMLIILGTSLTVYPACNMINYFNGKYLVIINKDTTSFDSKADLVINNSLNSVFSKLK